MQLVLDFTSADSFGAGASLLDCYQEALGHELPNHLVALQGIARLLEEEEGSRLCAEAQQRLQRLAGLSQELHHLVRALADIGRTCRDARLGGPTDLMETAREAVAEVCLLCPAAHIEYDFPGQLPQLFVSEASLRQVLIRLLHNACHRNPGAAPARVVLGARSAADSVELWVADDGPGLPETSAERLFAPFQRSGDVATPGLGLFLVRQVAAAWRGALRVDSSSANGTRFTVLVPILRQAPVGPPERAGTHP